MELTDAQWEVLERLLVPKTPAKRRGRPWAETRPVFEGVLSILRAGAQWSELPRDRLKLKDVKTLLRHEDIATTSNVYGDLGMDAKRRIQQRLVAFVNEQAKAAEETARIEAAWKKQPLTVQ